MNSELQKRIIEYGLKIDDATDRNDGTAMSALIDEIKQFVASSEEVASDPALYYFLGTALGEMMRIDGSCDYHREIMFYFRKALDLIKPSYPEPTLYLRLLTNYANELDTVGRKIEALSTYREALRIEPDFPMALGNYGRALEYYANIVNDEGHHEILHCYAYQAMKKALTIDNPTFHPEARAAFSRRVEEYERMAGKDIVAAPVTFKEYDLGEEAEREYRLWCLENHLFLNPLNDTMEMESAFCHDPLTVASLTTSFDYSDVVNGSPAEPPRWFAMLNQLKQEYAFARFLCYEGIQERNDPHFADKEVKLALASYDYTNHSFRLEQLKSAFKTAYSLLDQSCFFVNDFWKLGLSERKADAYHVCKSDNYPQDNTALTALYWLLCEFYEKYGDSETASEKELATLRNALEHKFVKVHEYSWERVLSIESDQFYHVSESDLQKYTLRLLHLSRETLMYLVYAVGIHERKNHSSKTVSMTIADIPDDWKR